MSTSSTSEPRPLLQRTVGALSVLDLPIAHTRALDPRVLLEVSGAARLGDLRPSAVAEQPFLADLSAESITQLRDRPAEAHALGHELLTALERRQVLWIAEVAPAQVQRLGALFGRADDVDVLHVASRPADAPGAGSAAAPASDTVVVALNPLTLIAAWCDRSDEHRAYLRTALEGADALTMPRRILALLRRARVGIIERSWLLRAARSPTVIAYAVVLIYSALRALPVMFVPHFHGRVWILWTIDLTTAIPYTWGIVAMVAARRTLVRIAGLLVAVGTFVAPYIYFWSHGRGYPLLVNCVVIGLIVAAIAMESGRAWREKVLTDGLRRG